MFDRRALAAQSLRAALDLRERHGVPDYEPICPFDVCNAEGITVRFVDFSMDGIYYRGSPARILLSARRPLVRRIYTCAHELGHHLLGHGSRLDELHDRATTPSWDNQEEFAADTIAAHLLMPTVGIRRALNIRSWSLTSMAPAHFYTLACDFGVGYQTLITHLSVGTRELSKVRALELLRSSPKTLRRQLLKADSSEALVICSPHRAAAHLDLEVGMLVMTPQPVAAATSFMVPVDTLARGHLYRAINPGTTEFDLGQRTMQVRIMPRQFAGLARYRHLESCE